MSAKAVLTFTGSGLAPGLIEVNTLVAIYAPLSDSIARKLGLCEVNSLEGNKYPLRCSTIVSSSTVLDILQAVKLWSFIRSIWPLRPASIKSEPASSRFKALCPSFMSLILPLIASLTGSPKSANSWPSSNLVYILMVDSA